MNICILSTVAPRQMSMCYIYINFFKQNNIKFDVIYLDYFNGRDFIDGENVFLLSFKKKKSILKLFDYLRFYHFSKKILKNGYDYVIVWNQLTAVLFCNFLKKHYKKKYIINIRDLFDERKKISYFLLNNRLNESIKYSISTTVASLGYIKHLPKFSNYVPVHSLNKNFVGEKHKLNDKIPVKIMFIGSVRFIDKIRQFIEVIGNDERFLFIIAGTGSKQFEDERKKYSNIKLIDTFPSSETINILNDADIIYNLYGTEYNCLKTALSQKLYLAVTLRIPILVYNDTYVGELADKCGLAFFVDGKEIMKRSLANSIYNWYCSLNYESIDNKCSLFEKEIEEQNAVFYELLDRLFIKKV